MMEENHPCSGGEDGGTQAKGKSEEGERERELNEKHDNSIKVSHT